jgi:hypothetical protein
VALSSRTPGLSFQSARQSTEGGVSCGAQDEPFQGTWDGAELRIETMHWPDINTQRMGGQCGRRRATYVLKRRPGGKVFEGEARLDGTSAVATMSVTP